MKQETLEEAFSSYVNEKYHSPIQGSIPDLESAKFGAQWQSERMYSEEEVIELLTKRCKHFGTSVSPFDKLLLKQDLEWFNDIKKL